MDIAAAVRLYLLAQAEISDLVSDRIFVGSLPKAEATSMPRKCIAMKHSGGNDTSAGSGANDLTETEDQRIDFAMYGETFVEAAKVRTAVHRAMKNMVRQQFAEVLLHRALPSGGSSDFKDPDGFWPLFLQSWGILGSTRVPVGN